MRRIVLLLATIGCAYALQACAMEVSTEKAEQDVVATSQALTVNDTLPTSGTKTVSITSNPGENNIVIMSSPSSGNWEFKIYGSPIGYDGCATGDHAVFTYWKDGPNGNWNYWPGGGGICWPSSFWTTNLYSGSSSISYKFVIGNYTGLPETPYGQGVYLKFTKL